MSDTNITTLAHAAAQVRGSRNRQDWARERTLAAQCARTLNADLAPAGYTARVVLYPLRSQ